MATNYKQIIERVLARFSDRLVNAQELTDGIGRRLLPHFIEAMPASERANWGVLEKRTSRPWNVPYDILVWKPTLEHFDVLTSRAISGDEKNDKTGPRRLIGTWGNAGKLPEDKPTWHWCDWRATANPIIPLESSIEPEPEPDDPPSPPPSDDYSMAFERFLGGQIEKFIALMNETRDGLAALRR